MNNTNGLQSSSANAYTMHKTENAPEGAYYDPAQYMRNTVELIDHMRGKFGYQVEFMHDVHERLTGIQALQLAKDLEPYKLFFLEDALQPEQGEWFEYIRKQTAVPLAMGELFVNPMEYKRLIEKRYIDYIRCHISMIGGLTPAIKLAHFADVYGVRTAWHGRSICLRLARRHRFIWIWFLRISASRNSRVLRRKSERSSPARRKQETDMSI